MKSDGYNILILDPGFIDRSALRDALIKKGFQVRVTVNEHDAIGAMEGFRPHLVLCRASERLIGEGRLLCGVRDAAAGKGIPFVIVSSGAGADFYLGALDRGIAHAIIAPVSHHALVERIRDIIERDPIEAPEGPLQIRCPYRGREHSLTATPAQLVSFILSLLDDAVRHASALSAMVRSRDLLHGRICDAPVFNGPQSLSDEEQQVEGELRRAVEKGEFLLHYQPVIDLVEDRVAGFEALVRWSHPSRGLLAPAEFIPLAEKTPLIIPLGFSIIEEAARQLQAWRDTIAVGGAIRVGINLSANQFVHPELSGMIRKSVERYHLPPETVGFEITESALMNDMESANLQLLNLKSYGHPISMDDFGTGYSSLSYLQHFPVDTLKIDRSFVRWMHMDEQSEHIVRSVVGLAHNLKMSVVAEGIEEESHLHLLRELDCEYGQGNFFSPPLGAEKAGEFLLQSYRKKRFRRHHRS
ncbi:MAG: EAL domain-containing protein [Spirochaetes bacterium]|nr:EAL domain-containing protein [Spirochaetota bacterium]